MAMALVNLDSEAHRGEIGMAANYLIGLQKANGSWDYAYRSHGDGSISQYALLGLWECENAGVAVPPSVWDRAASWYLSVQAPSTGSWNYHRDEAMYPDSISMTAAGVGSLLLCKRQLERYREAKRGASALLTPITVPNATQDYEVATSFGQIDTAVKKGMAWLGANFSTSDQRLIGQSVYYGLYGIERIGGAGRSRHARQG